MLITTSGRPIEKWYPNFILQHVQKVAVVQTQDFRYKAYDSERIYHIGDLFDTEQAALQMLDYWFEQRIKRDTEISHIIRTRMMEI